MRAVADLDHQRVDEDDRIALVQRPGLPCLDLFEHRVGDHGDGVRRQFGAVDALQVMADVAHRHPAGVEADDDVGQPAQTPFPLGHQGRGERARPVPRDVQRHRPDLGQQGLGCRAVAGVARQVPGRIVLVIAQMLSQLGRQAPLQHRLEHLGQEPARPGQAHPVVPHPGHHLVQQLVIEHRPHRRRSVTAEIADIRKRQPRQRPSHTIVHIRDNGGRTHRVRHRTSPLTCPGFLTGHNGSTSHPLHRSTDMSDRVDRIARAARSAGDPRTLAQLRADVFTAAWPATRFTHRPAHRPAHPTGRRRVPGPTRPRPGRAGFPVRKRDSDRARRGGADRGGHVRRRRPARPRFPV